jgi:hypothetical protein
MYSLLEIVKPSDFNSTSVLLHSNLGSSEKGMVVKSVIDFSKKHDDTWRPFTFE